MMMQLGNQESRNPFTRREFLATTMGAVAAATLGGCAHHDHATTPAEPVIDIHQHTNYSGRSDDALIAHQQTMGVTHSLLLPAGRFFGLDASCGGNETVRSLARRHPRQFSFFANEVPYLDEAELEIRKYLKLGALGIGEQKFQVDCDSIHLRRVADLAAEFGVPVLMHFQHNRYNTGIEGFHRVLEKYPRVNFIGHAQTWWANIDKHHEQPVLYPKTPVTPGGLGTREAGFDHMLTTLADLEEGVAPSISMLGYVCIAFWGVLGGIVYLFYRPGRIERDATRAETTAQLGRKL